MTTPAELLAAKYGEIPLIHVGDVKVVSTGGVPKELAFYAARVKAGNQIPYNIVLASIPLHLDTTTTEKTIAELPWVAVYLRSYFDLKHASEIFPIAWEKLAASPEHVVSSRELPGGMWLREVSSSDQKVHKAKHYTFVADELASRYLVTVESRIKNSPVGNALASDFEFDMLLSHNHHNVAIEKLSA